jgi:hypothetical protein
VNKSRKTKRRSNLPTLLILFDAKQVRIMGVSVDRIRLAKVIVILRANRLSLPSVQRFRQGKSSFAILSQSSGFGNSAANVLASEMRSVLKKVNSAI